MTPADLEEVVAVHRRSFPGFFLSQMGPRFLLLFYEGILSHPSGIALVCKQDRRVLGFVVGSAEPRHFYKGLLAGKWHRFAWASLVPALRNPMIVPRLLNGLRRTREEPQPGCGLLMSIAVDPQAQAGGIGAALAGGFLAKCRKRGLSSIHLLTDHFENDRANRFYSKLGFTVSRVITTPEGRAMNDYRMELT